MKQTPGKRERRYINIGGRPADLPFSDAVLVGDTLFLSGRIGIDPRTMQAAAEVSEEIRLLLDGIRATLEAAAMTMDDLVSVQVSNVSQRLQEMTKDMLSTEDVQKTSQNIRRVA